jgi:hypothetical protein
VLDRGLIEMMGPTGFSSGISRLSQNYSSFVATGLLYNSALSILVSATLFSILYTSPALIAQ